MSIDISIILVNWNTSRLLSMCISVLTEQLHELNYDLWVVDNASTDGSLSMLKESYPDVQVIANLQNVGFAAANNQAMRETPGRYFLLINTDAFPRTGAIQALYSLAEKNKRAAIIGAHLLNSDGSFQGSFVKFPNLWQEFLMLSGLGRIIYGPWYPNQIPHPREQARIVDYVQGACLLVRREAYEAVGGFDERYFMYSEEVDWCFAMRKTGWEVWYQPDAIVTHIGGASSKDRMAQKEMDLYLSRVRFFHKNYGPLPTFLLKTMLIAITSIKYLAHQLLSFTSRQRFGRKVVSPILLAHELKKTTL